MSATDDRGTMRFAERHHFDTLVEVPTEDQS